MKTSSYLQSKVNKKLAEFFDKALIKRVAQSSGFTRRKPRKITALAFVLGFLQSIGEGGNTYSLWAAKIGALTGHALSRQALFDRMAAPAVDFSQKLFKEALRMRLKTQGVQGSIFEAFNRVLIQDSTTLALPDVLSELFPGTVSRGVQKATARLQCLLNLKTMRWLDLSLKSFRHNDQGASKDALPHLKKGDLLIRDLGYFALEVFEQINLKKAFFLSRLRYGVTLFDEKGREVSWKQLAGKKKTTDTWVWMGKNTSVKVRLLFIPLPPQQAAERVRKAQNNRDQRLRHQEDYYRWLHYSVFITNCEQDLLPASQIAALYGVRWQIEILFKACKSGLHLQKMLHEGCTNIHRVKTTIYLLLMWFCMVVQKLYHPYRHRIKKSHGGELSLLKLFRFITAMLTTVLTASTKKLKEQLVKHCCYDTRKDRINMIEQILNLNLNAKVA